MSIYHQNCPPDLVPKYHIYPFLFQVFNLLCYQCWKGLLETNRKLKTHIDWDWRCLWMAQKPLRVWTELKRSHSVDCLTGASRNPSSSLQRGGSVPRFWLFLSSRSWFDLAEQIKLLWAPQRQNGRDEPPKGHPPKCSATSKKTYTLVWSSNKGTFIHRGLSSGGQKPLTEDEQGINICARL